MSKAKQFLIDKGLLEENYSKFTIKLADGKEFVLNELLEEFASINDESITRENMPDNILRTEILKKHLHINNTGEATETLFNYHSAMEEYAQLKLKEQKNA